MAEGWQPDEAYGSIDAGLSAMFRRLGVGTIRAWEKRKGYAEGFLRKTRYRRSLRLGDMLDGLQFGEVEPWVFFREVFPRPDGRGAAVPDRPPFSEPVASFAARARAVRGGSSYRHLALKLNTLGIGGTPVLAPLGRAEQERLAALDAQRYEDPKPVVPPALRLCRRALETGHGELALRAAGVLASALRLCMCLDDAETLLWAAYQQADRLHLDAVVGDLLQRMVYVVADRGEYELGLGLAKEALAVYADLGDAVRSAQTHVERGIMCFHLGRFRKAVQALEAALRALPPSERRHRYSALVECAFPHLALGAHAQAARCLRQAEDYLPPGPHFKGRLLWLRAAFAAHGGDAVAEGLYREALETFGQIYPADTAVCSIELVHFLLTLGRDADAQQLAFQTRAFAMTLPDGTVVQDAVWQLIRLEQLTPRRVHHILARTVGERSCFVQLEKVGARSVRPALKGG